MENINTRKQRGAKNWQLEGPVYYYLATAHAYLVLSSRSSRLRRSVARSLASDSAFLRSFLYSSASVARCSIFLVHDRPSSNTTRGKATVGQACGANIGGLRERSSIKIAVWCSWRTSYSPFPRLLLFLSSFPSFPPVFFLPLARPSSLRADRSDRIRSTNQRPVTLLCSFLFRTLPFLLVDK